MEHMQDRFASRRMFEERAAACVSRAQLVCFRGTASMPSVLAEKTRGEKIPAGANFAENNRRKTAEISGGITGGITGELTGEITGERTGEATCEITNKKGPVTGLITGSITGRKSPVMRRQAIDSHGYFFGEKNRSKKGPRRRVARNPGVIHSRPT